MAIKTFGKLQTGEADSLEFGFYGFRGGLNVKAAPQLVGDEDLTVAFQGYLRPDGAFQMRNGMATYGTAISGTGQLILDRFYQTVKNGTSIAEVNAVLGQFNGTLYSIPSSGSPTTIGSIGNGSTQATFARIQDPNDPNFVSGLTDCTVICTGVGGPYIYDGTNLYTPSGWSQASGASWCAVVNGILWFGGIPAFPNQIFGTGDGIIASMESLPAYRNFVLSAPVTGLVAQGTGATATLVIGRNQGVSVLFGTGPSTFFLQDVPFQDGVTAGRTMISANGVVYWLGRNAHYTFNAQTVPTQTSVKVEPWILDDPFTPGYAMTGNRGLSWSCIYNNRLHLGYCSNATLPNTILVYDLNLNAWTVAQTTPGLSSMVLLDAPNDPSPYGCLAGSATSGQAYTWDYVPPSTTTAVYDGTTPVYAQAQSKYFKLGVPGTNKALQRFYPEFLVSGTFSTVFTVSTDYGLSTQNAETTNPVTSLTSLMWDTAGSLWDQAAWGGLSTFVPFGSPSSRIDFPGIQGESFAFGVSMSSPLAPWIWSGGTGVYSQRGRT
jgi:hypothetical protein